MNKISGFIVLWFKSHFYKQVFAFGRPALNKACLCLGSDPNEDLKPWRIKDSDFVVTLAHA